MADFQNNCFKDAVCINAGRIYDSCSDKDCLEDLRVHFTDDVQEKINSACSVKCKKVEVLNVYLDVEQVPFNKGFYSVDMTFYFKVTLDVYLPGCCIPEKVCGLCCHNKKVILFGSEGNVKTFSTTACDNGNCDCTNTEVQSNSPQANVQVVNPIVLSSDLVDKCDIHCGSITVPKAISACFGKGHFNCCEPQKMVLISIGLFTIVQLERKVQMLIPVYDFCVPSKECVTTTDDPCEVFKNIDFPVDEFFPPKLDCDCDCHNDEG